MKSLETELSNRINPIDLRVKKSNYNLLLDLFNHGVASVQPKNILGKFLFVNNKEITIRENNKKKTYKKVKDIFVICVGKASVDMALTAKSIFSKKSLKIKTGVVVVNKENFRDVKGFKCFSSGHPIPNSNGLKAARFIKKTLNKLDKDDLVLMLISGGGSALLPFPVNQISLKDKILTNKLLLSSGANIKEINSVRKHLSQFKGGNLIKTCYPAKIHGLILSDVIGDDLGSISSGITTFDETNFSDVVSILKKYKLWKKIPIKVKNHISNGLKDVNLETPKKNNKIFKETTNTLIGSNTMCLKSIDNYCKKKKLNSKIIFDNIDMDVKKFSEYFVKKIKKIKNKKPLILLSGGETTVKLKGSGKGGRNQEFALHFLKEMKRNNPDKKFFLLSAGTDGRDGPTNAAGGIVDKSSIYEIKNKNINLNEELKKNNSYDVLKKINSLVIIKGTNTNVADIQILLLL
ncbi:MAG: glycerate kinase [Rickettsiales bacterium]|nr:glycerate kinase [Rickettsiales bacterium]